MLTVLCTDQIDRLRERWRDVAQLLTIAAAGGNANGRAPNFRLTFGSFYMHISMMSTINIRISVIKRNDKTGSVNVW